MFSGSIGTIHIDNFNHSSHTLPYIGPLFGPENILRDIRVLKVVDFLIGKLHMNTTFSFDLASVRVIFRAEILPRMSFSFSRLVVPMIGADTPEFHRSAIL